MGKDIIIITGGANGLGLALVKESIEKGLFVCNIDRDVTRMKQLNNRYINNYKGFIGDISDEEFIRNTINEISKLGNISILVNNAGEPSFKLPTNYENADIVKCFKGLKGMIICSTETLKIKQERDLKILKQNNFKIKYFGSNYGVIFDDNKIELFEKYISETLENGFWNEYIGKDTVFIFKFENGEIKRYVLNKDNEKEILKLCCEFADCKFESIDKMLKDNSFYAETYYAENMENSGNLI